MPSWHATSGECNRRGRPPRSGRDTPGPGTQLQGRLPDPGLTARPQVASAVHEIVDGGFASLTRSRLQPSASRNRPSTGMAHDPSAPAVPPTKTTTAVPNGPIARRTLSQPQGSTRPLDPPDPPPEGHDPERGPQQTRGPAPPRQQLLPQRSRPPAPPPPQAPTAAGPPQRHQRTEPMLPPGSSSRTASQASAGRAARCASRSPATGGQTPPARPESPVHAPGEHTDAPARRERRRRQVMGH